MHLLYARNLRAARCVLIGWHVRALDEQRQGIIDRCALTSHPLPARKPRQPPRATTARKSLSIITSRRAVNAQAPYWHQIYSIMIAVTSLRGCGRPISWPCAVTANRRLKCLAAARGTVNNSNQRQAIQRGENVGDNLAHVDQ